MAQSGTNQSPESDSLIIWEKTGNFVDSGVRRPICSKKSPAFSVFLANFPNHRSREFLKPEQGTIGAEQGIHLLITANHFQAHRIGHLRERSTRYGRH
jgi:hypothetical protein